MAKGKKCKLVVNNKWGYTYTPILCDSVAEAKRQGWDYAGGFYFRVVCDGKTIYSGYCKD